MCLSHQMCKIICAQFITYYWTACIFHEIGNLLLHAILCMMNCDIDQHRNYTKISIHVQTNLMYIYTDVVRDAFRFKFEYININNVREMCVRFQLKGSTFNITLIFKSPTQFFHSTAPTGLLARWTLAGLRYGVKTLESREVSGNPDAEMCGFISTLSVTETVVCEEAPSASF